MQLLFILIAMLLIFSFILKSSLFPRFGAVIFGVLAAAFLWLAIPWLTEQPRSAITGFLSNRAALLDISGAIVLEAFLMIGFCLLRGKGKASWLRWIPEILALPSLCILAAFSLYALPGVSFEWFRAIASSAAFILISGGSVLIRRISEKEEERLEALFLINIFILLLTVAAAGAFTF